MTMLRVALVQMTASDDPAQNLRDMTAQVRKAAAGGAGFVATPEVSNIISGSRSHQQAVLHRQADDPTLAGMRALAAELSVWVLLGSLALKTGDADGRFANRSLLIGPDGAIVAQYDKIHMFDVDLDEGESYRESRHFRPGQRAVLARTPFGALGMTICYDLRFARLFRMLAQAGAALISVPAAFTVPTGRAHWHALLRARAIETGCFILAPAQCGQHVDRQTYGHSLVVDPWGQVIAQAGEEPGVTFADLDLSLVAKARGKVPALHHDPRIEPPHDDAQQ